MFTTEILHNVLIDVFWQARTFLLLFDILETFLIFFLPNLIQRLKVHIFHLLRHTHPKSSSKNNNQKLAMEILHNEINAEITTPLISGDE